MELGFGIGGGSCRSGGLPLDIAGTVGTAARVTDPAVITRAMVKASGRTMEQVSKVAGLPTNACHRAVANPGKTRPSRHAALIRALTAPLPEQPEYAKLARQRRKAIGANQTLVARIAGVQQSTVSLFERTGKGPVREITAALAQLEALKAS